MKTDLHTDAVPVRLVIYFVGLIGVLSLIIGAWLFWMGKSGDALLSIANGCVMGLLGLLARTESRGRPNDGQNEPVEVTATDPLPVENVRSEPENLESDSDTPESERADNPTPPSPLTKAVRR